MPRVLFTVIVGAEVLFFHALDKTQARSAEAAAAFLVGWLVEKLVHRADPT
jgi:hypothetical protein